MPDLFHSSGAVISECGRYRYRLTRTWDACLPPAVFVMLNPSTADADKDDPTIRRCMAFARSWKCGGIVVCNLFAWRATDPAALRVADDPEGPLNGFHIGIAVNECRPVVAAWGAHGGLHGRDQVVTSQLRGSGIPVMCLGTTKDGHPRHPLYVSGNTLLIPFSGGQGHA